MDLKQVVLDEAVLVQLLQERIEWGASLSTVMRLRVA
jgi:hypothetical protein